MAKLKNIINRYESNFYHKGLFKMNIEQFKSSLKLGGQRANRFKVTLTNPADSSADVMTPFMIESTTLPQRTQEQIVQHYMGRQVKFNGNVTYPDWVTTVVGEADHKLRNSLETWCNFMNGYESNVNEFQTNEHSLYKSTAVVDLIDVRGFTVRSYELIGCFPIEVAGPELAWDSNELMKYGVTWTYDYFLIRGTTGNAGAILNGTGLPQ